MTSDVGAAKLIVAGLGDCPSTAREPMAAISDGAKAGAKHTAFHIPSLDGIRAISFFVVFVAHAGFGSIVPGYFGLSLFFFLSGYLITTLLRTEFDRTKTVSLKQFYIRRAFRILPPFYLVLLVAFALTGLGFFSKVLTWQAIASQLGHVTNYFIVSNGWWKGIAPGTWVYWSLAVEEHFYLVFPLVYLWLRRKKFSAKHQAIILLSTCALVLAWRCGLVFVWHASKDRTYVSTDTRVDSILAGCILAIWNNPVLDQTGPTDRSLGRIWVPFGLALVVASLAIREPHFDQTIRYSLQSFGLLPLFVAAIRWHDRGLFRWLNSRLAKRLGVLSYSMYLTHTAVIEAIETHTSLSAWGVVAVAFPVVVVLATLMHRCIELPFAKMRKRLA